MAGMPSAAGAASTAPSGTDPRSASMISWLSINDERLGRTRRLAGQLVELLLIDLALQLDDAVDERFGPRRATRHEDVHGDDLIDALHERVVVEHAADRRAGAHRDDILRFRHLVVDAAQDRRHLARQ